MIEPPVVGFTGVIWQARPTEQLSRDLTTGHGALPMADAGAAWAKLAASFGQAVLEFDQVVARIRESWTSEDSETAIERIGVLRDWLVDAATTAGHNATCAGGQAIAYEVAQLAMPHVVEIAALEAAKLAIEQTGATLGAPLVAAAARVESEQDLVKANAARVMESYESATSPLATPWEQQVPPVLVSSAPLDAEQAAAESNAVPMPTVSRGVMPSAMAGGIGIANLMPRVQFAYLAPTVAQSVAVSEATPMQMSPVAADVVTGRTEPGAMAPISGSAQAPSTVRAAAAAIRSTDEFCTDAGPDVAPPVLGETEQTQQPAALAQEAS